MTLSKRAIVTIEDELDAIADLAAAVHLEDMAGVILFFSPSYDPVKLEQAIEKNFSCVVVGCTTAGAVSPDYIATGISAISFSSKAFKFHSHFIDLEDGVTREVIKSLLKTENTASYFGDGKVIEHSIGLLLIDGLSMKEEVVAASIHDALPKLPIFGGSAGDDLNFEETRIFVDGKFHSNAAVFTFIETSLDFEVFKLQHFEPSDVEFVVTEADPVNRIVSELDGEPAAEYFAQTLGLSVDELDPEVFSMNPLMLQIGNDWYVRSIQKVCDDGSLLFYCAIDIGLPFTIGKGVDIENNLKKTVDKIAEVFLSVEISIGCDCILRRLELIATKKDSAISDILRGINFSGFSTYGEQFNSLHVNQTLTGVVFGEKA